MSVGTLGTPWARRAALHFHPDCPAFQALVDELVEVLDRQLAGTPSTVGQQKRLYRRTLQAAFADRQRKYVYSMGSDGIGEAARIRVTLTGALAYAAVLVELRKAHLRD